MEKTIICPNCKKEIVREFRFTDWDNDYNDCYGSWEECLELYYESIKEVNDGRYSIYAVTICPDCNCEIEDEGVIFNEECEVYKI